MLTDISRPRHQPRRIALNCPSSSAPRRSSIACSSCRLPARTLTQTCARTQWQVHACCLMDNHFHLVVETPQADLVVRMKWLLGTYTARFSRRHKLFGHLFSGRYKSLVVCGEGADGRAAPSGNNGHAQMDRRPSGDGKRRKRDEPSLTLQPLTPMRKLSLPLSKSGSDPFTAFRRKYSPCLSGGHRLCSRWSEGKNGGRRPCFNATRPAAPTHESRRIHSSLAGTRGLRTRGEQVCGNASGPVTQGWRGVMTR